MAKNVIGGQLTCLSPTKTFGGSHGSPFGSATVVVVLLQNADDVMLLPLGGNPLAQLVR